MAKKPDYLLPILSTGNEEALGGIQLLLENLWPETPSEGAGIPYKLGNTPGVEELPQIVPPGDPNQTLTGLFQQSGIFDGDLFAFWSQKVCRISALSPASGNINSGSTIAVSEIVGGENTANSSLGFTKAAAIRGYVSWVDGAYTAQVYDGASAAPVVDLPTTIIDVCSLAKRFVWIDGFTDTVYVGDLGLGTWADGTFFTAETISDKLNCCYSHSNRLYLAGDLVTEVYVPSSDYELPFAYTGVAWPIGSRSPGSWASVENFIGMVGSSTESLGVYQISGGGYEKISPNWLDRRLNLLSESERRTLTATAYMLEGHPTYELHIPGDGANLLPLSLGYDIRFRSWYNITDADDDDLFARRWVSQINTTPICGRASGAVGAFTRLMTEYFGEDKRIRWAVFQPIGRTAEQDDVVQQMQIMELGALPGDRATLASKAAIAAAGGIIYTVSDNLGIDFSPEKTITVNYHRKFGHFVAARRGGELQQPGRVHQFEATLPFNVEIGPLFVNMDVLIS